MHSRVVEMGGTSEDRSEVGGTSRPKGRGRVEAMNPVGDWDVTIKTPIGSLAVVYTFTEPDRSSTGTAAGKDETVSLHDIVVDRQRITWRQSVSRPMRLNLAFDVVVDGDRLHRAFPRGPSAAFSCDRRAPPLKAPSRRRRCRL